MNYLSVMATLPRLLNGRDAADYVCSHSILKKLCEHYGLRPIEKGHRLTVYDRFDVDAAIERMKLAKAKEM
jgi:hypothetical protein